MGKRALLCEAGLTVIELLVSIGILILLAGITFKSLSLQSGSKTLDSEALHIQSEFGTARSLTLSSKYADQWGIHLATSSITLFEGTSFVAGNASNTITALNSRVQISTTTLAGGGSDILFDRLTGKTSQSGSFILTLKSDATQKKTITIYATGLSDIQ